VRTSATSSAALSRSLAVSSTIRPPPAAPPKALAAVLAWLFAGVVSGIVIGVVALVANPFSSGSRAAGAEGAKAAVAVSVSAPTPIPVPPIAPPSVGAPAIEIDKAHTLVTFNAVAKGQRVLLDGQIVTTTDPASVKCGRHTIKIGAARPRTTTFPCGAALTLE
jgi:hypothetical protein